ncbi:MAG: DNA polymerase Y family protein [Gammaproteobacteria bacterium]|nr:DNA polymerase Y family protein [Gammaproteobacteria bacterium]
MAAAGAPDVVPPAARAGRPPPLWLALHLPRLPLEALNPAPGTSLAVISGADARAVVVAADERCRAAGIRAGMPASAACALLPALRLVVRDAQAEAAALAGLAVWAGQFTSCASLVPPAGLVLEVGGSLRFFGGLDDLLARVRRGIAALGYGARPGVAPTPLAAWLLARAGMPEPVIDARRLPGRLAGVPLECLDLPARMLQSLHRMGLAVLADCYRLPRDGLARRLDPALLERLDRALGKRPDPRLPHAAPPHFERCAMLPWEVTDAAQLLHAADRLLHELAGFLRARAAGVQALELHLAHRRGPATRLALELVAPTRDPAHLSSLLGERLARMELAQPVVYLGMRARALGRLAPATADLYGDAAAAGDDGQVLVERLRARLGTDAVRGLALAADHRPELAWRACRPGERCADPFAARAAAGRRRPPRPLWLMDPPRPLDTRDGEPWLEGALRLVRGPERIESGWWDGNDVARDYFEAHHCRGARYWIYHELRRLRRWYLHGIF